MRIQTATPPTPIRLDVLDLIDMLDATARELWRCLDGIDALDWRKDRRNEDLTATLIACAGHARLATFADAGFYMHIINDIARKVDTALDPPEQRREIGTCELCNTMLTAGQNDQWVICPLCGREQRAQTVKLRRLKTLCWDDSRRGSAADIAKAFTDAGITLKASRVRKWVERGQVSRTPAGDPRTVMCIGRSSPASLTNDCLSHTIAVAEVSKNPAHVAGFFAYLCFVFAWSPPSDTTSRTLSVPFIDGLRQPAARAPYRGVGLRELEVEQAATGDAKAFCDLLDAEIFSRHCRRPCR